MSYARRPMGDYKTYGYAGDPGFLSSLWRGIKKVAPAVIGGFLGGPAGALIAGVGGGGKPTPPIMPPGTVGGAISFPGGTSISGAVVPYGAPLPLSGRGGLPTYPIVGRGAQAYGGAGMGGAPSGYHFAKDGSGRIVRNRRMNIANPRALRRAMRRVQGFEKLAKRTIVFTRRTKLKKRRSS